MTGSGPWRPPLFFVFGLVLVAAGSCSSNDGPEVTGAEPTVAGATAAETPPDPALAEEAPTGQPLVDGLPVVQVLGPAAEGAGQAPQFRWEPVDGAARYSLAVRGPDGPLWAWQGDETRIYLGGLPFERPPGWAGPTIVAGTCWSVMARDEQGHVIAVSELLPVSPEDSPAHACVPGEGEEPGA